MKNPTEQDKRMLCRSCGAPRSVHKDRSSNPLDCDLLTFEYAPGQPENYRTLCKNCRQTGQVHIAAGGLHGCKRFEPEPWDEQECRICKHFAFEHLNLVGKQRGRCLVDHPRDCRCPGFAPSSGLTGRHANAVVTLIADPDGLDCPLCGQRPAATWAVEGLGDYCIDACRTCVHEVAADALADALPGPAQSAPKQTAGRYTPVDPHANCSYVGRCVLNLLDPHVRACR